MATKKEGSSPAAERTRRGHLRRLPALGLGVFCALALAVGPTKARAGNEPWEITADRITRFKDPAMVIAEGNVVLRPKQGTKAEEVEIKADWMRYDVTLGQVKARGHLSLTTPTEKASGEWPTWISTTRPAP